MDETQFARLAEIMGAIAAGDVATVFALHAEFGGRLEVVMRAHLRRMGVHRVTAGDLDGLVLDACSELAGCASAWDPGRGAVPWTWAARRLGALAARYVGHHAEPLDAASLPAGEEHGAAADDGPTMEVLAGLAGERPEVALLLEALELVACPRNREILLEVKLQAALGDPSPAVTVANAFGMRPDAVRQTVKRTLDRLRRLAASDARFAPLSGLAVLL